MSDAVEAAHINTADSANSFVVVLGTPVATLLAVVVNRAAGVDEQTGAAVTAVFAAVPAAAVLLRHRLRTSPRQRATIIAAKGLATNPFVVAVLIGSFLVFMDSLFGGLVGAIAGSTASGAADMGATSSQVNTLAASGMATGAWLVALPAILLTALLAGRRAAHYIAGRKAPVMLAAAGIYVALRLSIVLALGGMLSEMGLANSFMAWLTVFTAVGVALAVMMLVGAWWARRSHEGFVGWRLLSQLSQDDRRAAMDLLADAVSRNSLPTPTPSQPRIPARTRSPL
jgi:hypothetical protein